METKKSQNSPTIFDCDLCHYTCSKQSDFVKHKMTRKHINNTIGDKKIAIKEFICEFCDKTYNSRNGLWKHNKICNVNNINDTVTDEPEMNKNMLSIFIKENSDFKNLILEIVKNNTDLQKQNHDLQNKMMDMCKNSNTTINNNTNTKNSHNKTFNMQIFLNEHCKDAMNIKDFADSFQLQISDLEKVGHLGYVDGISDIIIKKLNDMDVHKRPIHCSDTKRDTMYVHADNIWIKENSDHDQVRMLVQRITAKNIRLIPIWQDLYPNSRNNMHKLNDTYMSLTRQAMGGFGGTIPENESKIIKKIAKTVFIDKHM